MHVWLWGDETRWRRNRHSVGISTQERSLRPGPYKRPSRVILATICRWLPVCLLLSERKTNVILLRNLPVKLIDFSMTTQTRYNYSSIVAALVLLHEDSIWLLKIYKIHCTQQYLYKNQRRIFATGWQRIIDLLEGDHPEIPGGIWVHWVGLTRGGARFPCGSTAFLLSVHVTAQLIVFTTFTASS